MSGEIFLQEKQRQIPRQAFASKVSVIAAFLMMLLTGVVGLIVDSMTMIIDSTASLIMAGTGILIYFTINRINKPPDESFNFGYHKYEPLTVAGQGLLIMMTCILAMKFALQDLIHPEDIKGYFLPVLVMGISGVAGSGLFLYLKREAAITASNLVKMASLHWKTDAILSFGMFCGFLLGLVLNSTGKTTFTKYIDPVMTIILAGYLMKDPVYSLIQSCMELLDASPGNDIKKKIKQIVDEHSPDSFGKHRIRIRKAGGRVFVDVRFEVARDITADRMAKLAHNFEKEVKRYLPDGDVVVFFKTGHGDLYEGVA